MAEGVLHVVMSLAWAVIAFGLDLPPSSWGGIALALLTANIACAGEGLLIGAVAYVVLDPVVLGNLVTFSVLLLRGPTSP